MLNASLLSYQAAQPLLNEFDSQGSRLDPAGLTPLLLQAQPELAEARTELDGALAARERIPAERLSPRLQGLLVEELDPVLKLADEGLSLARALPGMLGAASEGPKTYMLLPENEDELRPTGGFITSVGNLVLHNGQVISLDFESIDDDQVDWSKPYPVAPWQLREYMNSRVLLLRDSNWFTDFPTTALWAEYLYAYTHSHSVDGIIAFDQHFLVMLLGQIGPLDVDGAPYPITDKNVIAYMRQSKIPPPGETIPEGWYRKEFIGKLAGAILTELTPRSDERVLFKAAPSAFFDTDLGEVLKAQRVRRLTLVGLETHTSVLLSAADAVARGLQVVVPEPCVCARNADDHRFALRQIRDVWPQWPNSPLAGNGGDPDETGRLRRPDGPDGAG